MIIQLLTDFVQLNFEGIETSVFELHVVFEALQRPREVVQRPRE
ncbi:MAG: hypothetical protein RO257_17770 [Candidatus Kapabacteria bacterium]|nr:hypothetical protein [Candidatus Kapabacteria bacterium]